MSGRGGQQPYSPKDRAHRRSGNDCEGKGENTCTPDQLLCQRRASALSALGNFVPEIMTHSHACQGMLSQHVCYYADAMHCRNVPLAYIHTTAGVMQICASRFDAEETC